MTWQEAQQTGVSYSTWLTSECFSDPGDRSTGSAGVREPRPTRPNIDQGGVALELPPADDPPPAYLEVIAF